MTRVIFHLDMDAFYAAIEQRDHPAWRDKPVIVGSAPTERGVVCAASYEARRFGVHSAMPSRTAGRLCPAGIFVPPRMQRYQEESDQVMGIAARTGALIEATSIDEAYLDLSSIIPDSSTLDRDEKLFHAVDVARRLKQQIYTQRALTASIGIAGNKFLAKLASDFQKPNGLTLIPERDKVQFLRPLPVGVIHGVGKATSQLLNQAGIFTIGDLQDFPGDLRGIVGSFGPALKKFAFGEDDRPLEIDSEIKSISSENTFSRDTADRKILRQCLKEQSLEIAGKLHHHRIGAQTVQVKVRYGDFTTLTRQMSLEEMLSEARDIYRLACYLLAREKLVNRPLRLIGIGVSNLNPATCRQLSLPLFPGDDRARTDQTHSKGGYLPLREGKEAGGIC